LEQKLEAYVDIQKAWADAFSKYTGNVAPQIISGGSGQVGNAGVNFMEMMAAKSAKDLLLDMKVDKNR